MTELMTGKDDEALLRELRATGDRGVLEELVRRHVDFVYSAARRQVGGDAHLAEDVTQGVFVLLGKKRPSVAGGKLAGWLFNTTRFVARNAVKMEMRRRKHERAAAGMREEAGVQEEARWEAVGPVLDGAVAKLGRGERDVVLMHYFQNMTLADVARKLGISEVAARQRSSRAVGKLREMLAKQGVACSAVGLAEGMRKNAVGRAPEGVAAKAGAATGGGVAAATSAAAAMTALKLKVAAAVVGAAVVVGGGVVMVERQLSRGAGATATATAGLPPAADVASFKTFHGMMTIQIPGLPVRRQELAADTQKGAVGLTHCGTDTLVETFDGTTGYRFKEGGDLVVKPSRPNLDLAGVRRIVGDLASWRASGPVREAVNDATVNGERWQAWGVTRWRLTDGRPATVWVDSKGVPRRAKMKESPGDKGLSMEFEAEFDRPLPVRVPAELPKGARVVGEEQLLEELYPLKGALATAEAASHVLAVHSAKRDADGRYHVLVSVRPNEAARALAAGSPPANYVVRPDGEMVRTSFVTARQDLAGVSVRDVVIVPGSKVKEGVCEFEVTMLPWGEITGALQERRMPISGMARVSVKVEGRAGSLAEAAGQTFDRVSKLSGAVTGGVSLETRGTIPVTFQSEQVGREAFVASVVKRASGK